MRADNGIFVSRSNDGGLTWNAPVAVAQNSYLPPATPSTTVNGVVAGATFRQSYTPLATGVLNTGGNGGGLIGIPIVAYLSGHGHWTAAFVIGAVFSVLGAVAWLGIDADERFVAPETPGLRPEASEA